MIAHHGVRIGRATHIVDMSSGNQRASYTALSNTIIGSLLVIGGFFGFLAQAFGIEIVLLVMAGMCLGAVFSAKGLEEAQS